MMNKLVKTFRFQRRGYRTKLSHVKKSNKDQRVADHGALVVSGSAYEIREKWDPV